MRLKEFLSKIKGFNYVVQRHWAELPKGFVPGHEDLDLFTVDRDKPQIEAIAKDYPEIKIDVRSFADDYYPKDIGDLLLMQRYLMKDLFWVPHPTAYFLALYYHNLVHKEGDPYKEELEETFKKLYQPLRCKDEGVGYFV